MITWERDDNSLCVVDTDNAELTISGADLTVTGPGQPLPRPTDTTLTVRASELRFPNAVVYAFPLDDGDQYTLDHGGEPLSLSSGTYLLDIDTEIKAYVRFSGRAQIRKTVDFSSVVISFDEPTELTLGLRSRHEQPAGTLTIPQTPQGVARALTHLSSSHKTDGPDRTYPTLRGHPPLVTFGDSFACPDPIRETTPDTGIELRLPPTYESIFVAAPLSYYLQATVTTEPGVTPHLRLPEADREHTLSAMPQFERDVEQLLRKTFFLDSLVRNAGPYRTTLSEFSLLKALGLDANELYEAEPHQRLATYLDVPYTVLEHRLPDWHLSTYVEPVAENVETLPFLLDRLSLIYTPRTSELEGKELVERSLNDFYRQPTGRQVPSVDIIKPELRSGKVHGWLADGVPIDVFKSTPQAYHNRLTYLEGGTGTTSIAVVLNDPEMDVERTDVSDIYRKRAQERQIDVTVTESLGTASLARLFESEHDFVHYIGHCETGGLRCPDGTLSTDSVARCRTETFFLNACGSFYEGMGLIEKGSVAGAVTFSQVLNEHAVKVGSAFAKLLSHGFSIEWAMRLARRRIMMGKDYAVVGDGTHSLTPSERLPTTATVEQAASGAYILTLECFSTRENGSYYVPHVSDNEYAYLCGTDSTFILERESLETFLKESETPVIYDGDVYWSQDLWGQLAN